LRIAAESLTSEHSTINLNINKETLLDIISLLNDEDTYQESSKELREFCILLIVPPLPFINSAIDKKFASETLLAPHSNDESAKFALQRQKIAGILSSQS
jgi:hypothetical protein